MEMKKYAKKTLAALLAASTLVSGLSVMTADAVSSTADDSISMTMPLVTAGSSVTVVSSAGYEEGAYAVWAPVDGADGYNVYCDGVQLDSMLIRQYSDGSFRADAVGIKAGSHTLKIVPTSGGSEMASAAAEATVTSTSYDRSGFCFASNSITGGSGIGAYNDDGTLKSNAVVLYVTEETKNTITMDVQTAASKTTSCTGIGAILKAMQKGYESRPVCIRIIGKVTIDGINTSGDTNNLLLKASATDSPIQNITVEGIGDDATCYGWGIRCQRARSIEIRNLAVMLFGDDGIALETDNYNIWVHDNDIFYGTAGSDADQAKGDGSMDLKNDSKYITISYNHFWDSGKMSLCGMKSETAENWIT
ncbi:MAG: pectate lyase, partial [Oscillospiraceae bacterium]|nr:pectate lyase [Oscillospiraceae bacterium]